jgi:hypothetical protein
LLAVRLDRKHEARTHGLSVDEHRARATFTFRAALLRAGQPDVVAQNIEERVMRNDVEIV